MVFKRLHTSDSIGNTCNGELADVTKQEENGVSGNYFCEIHAVAKLRK